VSAPQPRERYRDGIIIWATPDDVAVPFLLRFFPRSFVLWAVCRFQLRKR
jgi:hypothetical protein